MAQLYTMSALRGNVKDTNIYVIQGAPGQPPRRAYRTPMRSPPPKQAVTTNSPSRNGRGGAGGAHQRMGRHHHQTAGARRRRRQGRYASPATLQTLNALLAAHRRARRAASALGTHATQRVSLQHCQPPTRGLLPDRLTSPFVCGEVSRWLCGQSGRTRRESF